MRKHICLGLALLAVLFCTACTAAETVKNVKIEKALASDGSVVCTIVDLDEAGALWDRLLAAYEEKAMAVLPENASPLYIYTVYQTETQKAGQTPEELELVPIMRYTVYKDADLLTEEILPEVAGDIPFVEEVLRCTFRVDQETADFLRTYE